MKFDQGENIVTSEDKNPTKATKLSYAAIDYCKLHVLGCRSSNALGDPVSLSTGRFPPRMPPINLS